MFFGQTLQRVLQRGERKNMAKGSEKFWASFEELIIETRIADVTARGLRERDNFTSPFSQHWLMRTRLGWSHQPS